MSPSSGWHRLPLMISAERIGEIVNLNRVSVARQLSFWMKADLVRRDGRKLLFSDQLFAAVDDWIENPVPKCPLPAKRKRLRGDETKKPFELSRMKIEWLRSDWNDVTSECGCTLPQNPLRCAPN